MADRQSGLQSPNHTDHGPDHTGLRTGLDTVGGNVFEEAAKARGVGQGAESPSGPSDRACLNRRDAGKTGSIGHEKLRGEVVGAFDDQIVPRQKVHRRAGNESAFDAAHAEPRRQVSQDASGSLDLGGADVLAGVQGLTVQVAFVNRVVVDDRDLGKARSGEQAQHR
jgi:hypothetical protein